jgi:hypothetical protein
VALRVRKIVEARYERVHEEAVLGTACSTGARRCAGRPNSVAMAASHPTVFIVIATYYVLFAVWQFPYRHLRGDLEGGGVEKRWLDSTSVLAVPVI